MGNLYHLRFRPSYVSRGIPGAAQSPEHMLAPLLRWLRRYLSPFLSGVLKILYDYMRLDVLRNQRCESRLWHVDNDIWNNLQH